MTNAMLFWIIMATCAYIALSAKFIKGILTRRLTMPWSEALDIPDEYIRPRTGSTNERFTTMARVYLAWFIITVISGITLVNIGIVKFNWVLNHWL